MFTNTHQPLSGTLQVGCREPKQAQEGAITAFLRFTLAHAGPARVAPAAALRSGRLQPLDLLRHPAGAGERQAASGVTRTSERQMHACDTLSPTCLSNNRYIGDYYQETILTHTHTHTQTPPSTKPALQVSGHPSAIPETPPAFTPAQHVQPSAARRALLLCAQHHDGGKPGRGFWAGGGCCTAAPLRRRRGRAHCRASAPVLLAERTKNPKFTKPYIGPGAGGSAALLRLVGLAAVERVVAQALQARALGGGVAPPGPARALLLDHALHVCRRVRVPAPPDRKLLNPLNPKPQNL